MPLLAIPKKELEKSLLIKDAKWYRLRFDKFTQEVTGTEVTWIFTFYMPEIDREIDRQYQLKWIGFINALLDALKVEKNYQNGQLLFDPEKYYGVELWGKLEHQPGTKNPAQLFNNLADFRPGDAEDPNISPF